MTTSDQWLIEGLDGSALIFGDGVLTIEGADGRAVLRVTVPEILSVNVAAAGPDEDAFVFINFTDPDVSIENTRLAYTPYRLRIHPKRAGLAARCAADLKERILASRRRTPGDLDDPELVVPPVESVDVAAAVDQATARMASGQPLPDAARTNLIEVLHPTEVLLEMMRCTNSGARVLCAVTHRRVLFVGAGSVAERPLAAVRWVYPLPGGTGLFIQDIVCDNNMKDADPEDVARVMGAIERAIRRQGHLGSLRPRTPGVLDLFAQYETVTERAKLGMVTDEQAGHELSGICFATAFQ